MPILTAGFDGAAFLADADGTWTVICDTKIVEDGAPHIQSQIKLWSDTAEGVNLVVTTGGTGFAVSDTTPEVCRAGRVRSGSG